MPCPDQRLVQQPDVDQDPHRHVRVHSGLEFQQQVEIEPVWPPAHAPDEIIVPAAQVVTDVAVTDPFKGAPVDVADPRLVDKAAEQVFDHPGVRKEQLVAGVVFHGHEYSAEADHGARCSVRRITPGQGWPQRAGSDRGGHADGAPGHPGVQLNPLSRA